MNEQWTNQTPSAAKLCYTTKVTQQQTMHS